MKNLNSLYKATALGLAMVLGTSVLVMNGCKNPVEDIKVAIATQTLSKSATLIRFVKANPSGAALPATITVTIGGAGKDLVQTDNGGKDFVASNGILPLSLNRFANPTAAAPVVFTVSANVAGYAPVFKQITISSVDDIINVELPLLSYTAPADGTAIVQTEKALTGGVSVADTKFETTASTATPQSVDVVLAAGTQLQDANKQPINAASVKTTMVYYGTNDTDALDAAAPFLVAVNPIGPNGQPITGEVSFVTAGAISINMTAGTTDVKNFSKPMSADIEINPALINPITGVAVKAGDVIPVWSLNEATGQWKHEGTTTVTNAGGKLVATISISHLSTWALNWYNAAAACNTSFNLTLGTDAKAYEGYSVEILTANNQRIIRLYSNLSLLSARSADLLRQAEGNVVSALTRLNILPAKIVVSSRHDDPTSIVLEQSVTACGTYNINIPAPQITDFIDTEILFSAECTNKKMVAYPTTWVVLTDVTEGTFSDQHMQDGKLNLKLKNGHSYTVTAVYDKKTYTSEAVKIDRTSTINVSNASGLVVNGVYNAASKKLPLTAKMTVNNCK